MIDIEQQAINTFQKNYAYFSSNHPSLYQKINILQSAIESQQYQENYSLEYINGAFDIKELGSGQFFYGSSSIEHAEATAKNVNLKKNESVIETFYNFPYTQANIEDLDKLTIINSHMTGTAPIVRFMNEHTSNSDEMKKIFKFIFFGVGVGEHLTAVDQKISADSYFIIEDNLELFRLSMFVTDYEALGKKARLFFSVMDSPGEFKHTYNLFAEDMLIRNSHLKFYLLSNSYASKIKQIQNFAVTKSHLIYPYNYLLRKNLRISHALHENYNFLNIFKPFENSPFADKPLLYLAAGPSLNANIDWIKENQDYFIIVAVFMITAKLEKAGIYPDVVVHVDEAVEPVESTLSKIICKDFLKESVFILAASVPLELFEPISKKENIFLIEDRTHYKKDHGSIEFFSVGEVGYALSLIFGAKDIYLLGLDLALDQETGQTHTDGHSTLDKVDISKGSDAGPEQMGSLRKTLIPVKGNTKASVLTTPLFDTSIHQVNHFSKLYKQVNQNVYNLGNGAYFEGSTALKTNDVKINAIDKNSVKPIIYSYFTDKSTDQLSDIEKNNIIIRKNEVKKKAKLIERFAKQNIKNIEDFRRQFVGLIGSLIEPVSQELNEVSEIFLNYFQTVGNYIGNFLNSEGMSDSDRSVKELQQILSRQLYKILHDIGNFEFNYINGEKYFEVGEFRSFQNKILDFKLRPSNVSKINEISFFGNLSSEIIDEESLKNLYTKDAIGFLAVEMNLEDEDFVYYIKELFLRYPQVTFKAFYFNDEQKRLTDEIFRENRDRIQKISPSNLRDLSENIEIYVCNASPNKELQSNYLLQNKLRVSSPFISVIYFDNQLNQTLEEKSKNIEFEEHIYVTNHEYFGFSSIEINSSNKNIYNLIYNKIFKIIFEKDTKVDLGIKASEMFHFNQIEYALKYTVFKEYFYNLYLKEEHKKRGQVARN